MSPPRIDALVPLARDPSLVRIEVDGEEFGILLRSTVDELGLRIGRPLSKALAARIHRSMDVAKARTAALRSLASRDRPRRRLIDELVAKGHGQAAATAAVDGLLADGWIDDARYAETRARSLLERKPLSHAFLAETLRAEGVDDVVADATARRAAPPRDDLKRARALARQAKLSGANSTGSPSRQDKRRSTGRLGRRVAMTLARAGFEADTIAEALASAGLDSASESDT